MLLASFVLVNVLIGVVLNALEEAREMEEESEREEQRALLAGTRTAPDATDELLLRIAAVRSALDDMENQLGSVHVPPAPLPGTDAAAPPAHASAGAR